MTCSKPIEGAAGGAVWVVGGNDDDVGEEDDEGVVDGMPPGAVGRACLA